MASSPSEITLPPGDAPAEIRDGVNLTVNDGGIVGDFFLVGQNSTLTINPGGGVGGELEVTGGTVNLFGGDLGKRLKAYSGSEVNLISGHAGNGIELFDGSVLNIGQQGPAGSDPPANPGPIFREGTWYEDTWRRDTVVAHDGSSVNIFGGAVHTLTAWNGSETSLSGGVVRSIGVREDSLVNISAGEVAELSVARNAEVRISGGLIGDNFLADSQSEVHLFGTEFSHWGAINGELQYPPIPIEGLEIGVPHQITERGLYVLEGVLADGSPIDMHLRNVDLQASEPLPNEPDVLVYSGPEYVQFLSDAVLTVTLVNQPGDYDGDGVVDFEDRVVWETAMITGDLAADGNYDRVVDEADLVVWQQRQGTVYRAVPEPAFGGLACVTIFCLRRRRLG